MTCERIYHKYHLQTRTTHPFVVVTCVVIYYDGGVSMYILIISYSRLHFLPGCYMWGMLINDRRCLAETYAVISFAGQGWVTGFGGTSGRHIFVHVQTYENIY